MLGQSSLAARLAGYQGAKKSAIQAGGPGSLSARFMQPVTNVAGPAMPNAFGQNRQRVRSALAPTAPVQQIRPLSERLKDPLLQKTIDEGGIPERAPLPTPPSPDAIIAPRPRQFVNPFEGEELMSPPKSKSPGRVDVAARPDQNFATSVSPRPFGGSSASPSGLPAPPAAPGRLSDRFLAPTAGTAPASPPESPTSIPPAGPGLNTTQVAPPRGPGYVNMATVGHVDRAPSPVPPSLREPEYQRFTPSAMGERAQSPLVTLPTHDYSELTPAARQMAQRLNLDPAGTGGAFATFANNLAERQGQPKLADRFRLPTNQEATLAGGTPNVTASPNFGSPAPAANGSPLVQRFKQPEAPPQFVNTDGKAMLNDPATLNDRVAAARQRLSDRLTARATPTAPVAEPAAPPAPPAPPSAALPAAPPLAAAGPEGPKRPSVLDRLNGTGGTEPVSVPAAAPAFTRFTPPAAAGIPAANVTGPVTSPEQVAANKQRRADELARRDARVQERGIARGQARTQRLESRKRGPSLVDQLAARNPAFAAEVVRQQGAQALADKELGFRKGENAADRAQRGELAGKDFELKGRTLSETERANQAREGLSRDQLTSGDRRLSEELRSREKVAGINAAATQGASKETTALLADASAHQDAADKLRAEGKVTEANRRQSLADESRRRAMGGTVAPPPPASGGFTSSTPLSTRLTPQDQAAVNQRARDRMFDDKGNAKSPDQLLRGFAPDLDAIAQGIGQMTPDQARQYASDRGISEEALQKIADYRLWLPYQQDPGRPSEVDLEDKRNRKLLAAPDVGPLSIVPWLMSGESRADYEARIQRQQAAEKLLGLLRSRSA
jgi:hypothetical protein